MSDYPSLRAEAGRARFTGETRTVGRGDQAQSEAPLTLQSVIRLHQPCEELSFFVYNGAYSKAMCAAVAFVMIVRFPTPPPPIVTVVVVVVVVVLRSSLNVLCHRRCQALRN